MMRVSDPCARAQRTHADADRIRTAAARAGGRGGGICKRFSFG